MSQRREKNVELPEIEMHPLLNSRIVRLRDTFCRGTCSGQSHEECTRSTQLVFPYRGVYVRHVGGEQTVAEANQVLFFNATESYRVSHPVQGGDSSMTLILDPAHMEELAPAELLHGGPQLRFKSQGARLDPEAQVLVAILRQSLWRKTIETLEAETLALTLVRRALGPRSAVDPRATFGRKRLVDRIKLVLAGDLSRRWTLADIAAEVHGSPVYLTQVFQQVEGIPLYRYQLRLRLARALDLLREYDDLTALSLDLGFSSHSHFSAAFRQHYGLTPRHFKQTPIRRFASPSQNH